MRIGINCCSICKPQYTGIGRYTYNLVHNLKIVDEENDYFLYFKKSLINFRKKIPVYKEKNLHVKWDFIKVGSRWTLRHIDLYHTPSVDYVEWRRPKIVTTIHDIIYKTHPQGHTDDANRQTDTKIKNNLRYADKIICCSQSTINDLKAHFPVEDDKLRLVYQGIDHNVFYEFNEEEREHARSMIRRKGVEEPYLLFVGTIEPRKNLRNLLLAFAELKRAKKFQGRLVVIGMKGWMSEGILPLIDKLGIKQDVIFLGYLTDWELCSFYNLAEIFVFPSFYEGFGFPLLEAFCCGTPVITSNISSCPEVAADAALLIDPKSAEEIRDAVDRILSDSKLREALKVKGLRRARDFNYVKTAQETLNVYKELI